MSIAYSAYTESGAWNNAESSVTWAHTCPSNNPVLVVFVNTYAKRFTSATYNGTAMTYTAYIDQGTTRRVSACILNAPATGEHNVVVTCSSNDYVRTRAVSYSGAKQSGQPNTYATKTQDSSGTVTATVTTTAVSSLVMGFDTNANWTDGTGTTQFGTKNELITARSADGLSSGSNSLTGTTSTVWFRGIIYALEEAPAVGPVNLKSWNGLAKASIKSVNGLAIASVKKIDGLA